MPDLDSVALRLLAGLGVGGLTLGDLETEDLFGEAEHALDDLADREVGAHFLLVEIVVFLAQFLRPVGHVPGLEEAARGGLVTVPEIRQFIDVTREVGFGAGREILHKFQRGFPAAGHALLENLVGEMGVTEEFGPLVTKGEDLPDEAAVVVFARMPHGDAAAPDFLAQTRIVGVFEHGEINGSLEGDPVDGRLVGAETFRRRLGAQHAPGRLREPGEARVVFEDELPGIGRVEHVLGEFLGDAGKLGLHLFETLFLGLGQVGSAADEVAHRLLEETFLDACQGRRVLRIGVGLDPLPQSIVQRDAGVELGHLGQHRIVGSAQGLAVAHGVKVPDPAPGHRKILGGAFKFEESVFKGQRRRIKIARKGIDRLLRPAQRLADVGLDRLGNEARPAQVKIVFEEGMSRFRHARL